MRERIGIMGGTFDPIHAGHLAMAQAAWKQAGLKKVLFMPSKIPPHKRLSGITGETERAEMVQRAIADWEPFDYSDYELRRSGTTYTADTLMMLQKEQPEYEWCFIMGGDSFIQLENWYKPELIMRSATILAVGRDGVKEPEMRRHKAYLEKKYQAVIQLLHMPEMDISSTQIRSRIAAGESVAGMVPQTVLSYIIKYGLYR